MINASAFGKGFNYNYLASKGVTAGPVNPSSGYPQYSPPAAQVLGTAISRSAAPIANTPTQSGPNPQQLIQSGQDAGNSQIEADFNQAMSMLNDAESGLRGQAGAASGQIDSGATAAKNEITNTQNVAQQGVNQSVQTAERQGKSAIAQARDLYSQTQQQNNAQLSALGISSSSVAQALAERLGVETARRISGVTGSLDEVRQNATNELGRINTYYQGKVTDLQNWVNDQKATIQNSLVQGINQINSARNQAASQKAQARAGLLQQVQSQLGQLAASQQQFEQSLQAWAQQKSAALTPIAQDPNYLANLTQSFNNFAAGFDPSRFNVGLNVDQNAKGQYQSGFSVTPKKQDKEDPLAALYAQAGV